MRKWIVIGCEFRYLVILYSHENRETLAQKGTQSEKKYIRKSYFWHSKDKAAYTQESEESFAEGEWVVELKNFASHFQFASFWLVISLHPVWVVLPQWKILPSRDFLLWQYVMCRLWFRFWIKNALMCSSVISKHCTSCRIMSRPKQWSQVSEEQLRNNDDTCWKHVSTMHIERLFQWKVQYS